MDEGLWNNVNSKGGVVKQTGTIIGVVLRNSKPKSFLKKNCKYWFRFFELVNF